jgi:hypothetical protein
MRRAVRLGGLLALLLSMLALTAAGAGAALQQHGPTTGHLIGTGEWGKIDFVSKLAVHDAEPELIADLTVFGDYAYLARWGGEACAGPEGGGKDTFDGGVYVIDISDLENPKEVGFIATSQDTLVGEGMQVIHLDTAEFTGDVLLMNHEGCGKNFKGGLSLWDVTDPTKPKKLHEHFGDITIDGARDVPDVNQTHSGFMWDAGDRAYLVATDDEEATDVDIFDITNPKHPKLIAEFDLNELGVSQPELGLTDSFLHDMVVKEINGRFIMLLSYWDGGWVMLDVTDPANPIFLGDSDYPPTDPEVAGVAPPEGNAHQAEFTIDNRFVIGTDEDFDPFRFTVNTDDGGAFRAKTGTQTTDDEATAISGTTVFVGRACPGDEPVPPAPDVGDAQIAVVERGSCLFEEKAQAVLAAGGYEAMIIMNREGADACNAVLTPSLTADIPTLLIGREAGYALFDIEDEFDLAACLEGTGRAPIAVGTIGDVITSVDAQFDAWGYVHLLWVADFDAATGASLVDVDTFAIPEALDPAFAEGFGDLSVHEVAVDPLDPSIAYLSYYSGGLRAIQIQCAVPYDQVDTLAEAQTCRLVEVGGYLDPNGNNFWGVETRVIDGQTYIFASDRDSGLWIFRDP